MPINKKQLVLNLVEKIPKGKVTSYGKIASLLDLSPRTVGFIMTGLSEEESEKYPWQRVVDRNGYVSSSKLGERGILQQELLKKEGVEINNFQILNIEKYWHKF